MATIIERAKQLGKRAADAYWDEFGATPAGDRERVGDWDTSAWELHWMELRDFGMTDEEYETCLAAWRSRFWAHPPEARQC